MKVVLLKKISKLKALCVQYCVLLIILINSLQVEKMDQTLVKEVIKFSLVKLGVMIMLLNVILDLMIPLCKDPIK